MGVFKRRADVPDVAHLIGSRVSKADLLEVAYSLASLCNDADSCDDVDSSLRRLLYEINVFREQRGQRPLNLAPHGRKRRTV